MLILMLITALSLLTHRYICFVRIRASGCGRKKLLHFETEDVFQEKLFIFLGKGTGHANRVETLSPLPLLRSSNLKCSEQTFSSRGDRMQLVCKVK